jgi:hypothetical protein
MRLASPVNWKDELASLDGMVGDIVGNLALAMHEDYYSE